MLFLPLNRFAKKEVILVRVLIDEAVAILSRQNASRSAIIGGEAFSEGHSRTHSRSAGDLFVL